LLRQCEKIINWYTTLIEKSERNVPIVRSEGDGKIILK
jgi:hypothetical protein